LAGWGSKGQDFEEDSTGMGMKYRQEDGNPSRQHGEDILFFATEQV
jgi:hypothetical protein